MFLASQIFGSEMARAGSGSIINVASTYGIVAPDQSLYKRPDGSQSLYKSPAYPATEGAVVFVTRYLAAYWVAHSVRVKVLTLGGVVDGRDAYFVEQDWECTLVGLMAPPKG